MNSEKRRCLLIVEDDAGLHSLSRWSFDGAFDTVGVAR